MRESIKKNKVGIILMFFSSICVCLGQLFWKLSVDNKMFLLLGFALYGIGAIIMIIAYRFGSLSVLQPMLSMNYVLSLILGYCILSESISAKKLIGIVIIMFGVVLIGGGESE